MKHVACFALFTLIPALAFAQTAPTPQAAPPPGYYPPGYYAPPPGYYPPAGYYPPPPGYAAQAAPSGPNLTGFTFAVGLGYGVPFGDILKVSASSSSSSAGTTVKMSDAFTGQIPFSLSAGFRATPMVSFGLAFQYAPVLTTNCSSGETCSASDTSFGGEFRLHFAPQESFSPWLAADIGYEWLGISESGSSDLTLSGWLFGVQVGGDIRVTPFMTLGPFVGLRVGTYSSGSSSGRSADIPDDMQATHGWVLFGVRGAFTFTMR